MKQFKNNFFFVFGWPIRTWEISKIQANQMRKTNIGQRKWPSNVYVCY